MANEISVDFDELSAYIKRLAVAADGLTGSEVAQTHGPGGGAPNATTQFHTQLARTARSFGTTLEKLYADLRNTHDELSEVLKAAVEQDASLADEAAEVARLINQIAPPASTSPQGQIG